MRHLRSLPFLLLAPLLPHFDARVQAADFPPITDEERALTSVPGEPNAPAVVLFKKGDFQMQGYSFADGSLLRVQARVKILTEEGKRDSEIAIAHGYAKLQSFEGRTVLPDRRIVPVGQDAKFVRKTSRVYRTYVTAVAFPSVEVGAILDYQFEVLLVDSPFLDAPSFLDDPWYFSEEVPVRYAEIIFRTPRGVLSRLWSRTSLGTRIETESRTTSRGFEVRAWAADLPSVPDDPYGPPFRDLATQLRLLPVSQTSSWMYNAIYESWPKVCESVVTVYGEVRRRDVGVARRARKIAGSGTLRQQAELLYRFVRDQLTTEPDTGIGVDWQASLRELLTDLRAEPTEKALLLQAMLEEIEIESRLVWAADRNRGAIDVQLPNPLWFDKVLVMAELDGQRVFLDPTDRALSFGQLRPGYEATQALIPDRKKPDWITLPMTPHDQSLRHAEIDLGLDGRGRLSGKGTLLLTGQRALEKIDWQEKDTAARLQAWKDWLAEQYRDFQVSDVEAVEAPDERKLTVAWSMAQREEEVLGDEVSLKPSVPLGPIDQPFVQPASSRKTAVMFPFAYRDEVELRLHWPEGWNVESLPSLAALQSIVGALSTSVELKEGDRFLLYRRRLDVTRRTLGSKQEYEATRSLFAAAEKSDAQALVLVRR